MIWEGISMLYIQDPNYKYSKLLNDELLNAIRDAKSGFGTYAFVTSDGLKMLFENDVFNEFMKRKNSSFTLIMGIDEVTNEKSLEEARALCDKYSNFTILVFLDLNTNTIYHPKFAAFEGKQGGKLIIGSGNLTTKGLRKNREAFTVTNYSENEFKGVIENWEEWIRHNKDYLKCLDDVKVVEKARENSITTKENIKRRKKIKKSGKQNPASDAKTETYVSVEDESDSWRFSGESRVLVMEIPKNRPGQINFHKETINNFFCINTDNFIETAVVLRSISELGNVGEVESRMVKYKGSNNYYFELSAQSKKKYPDDNNRPIGIFLEIAIRTYLYMYLLPQDKNFAVFKDYMISKRKGNQCAQEIINVEVLKQISPDLRMLEYLDNYMEIE